MLVVLSALK